jgi:ASC-1-like (ASCH) protein
MSEKKINTIDVKKSIISAGHRAVEQLIKVAKEEIIKKGDDDDLAADKLKNAAATKKLAIFDAFEILERITQEEENISQIEKGGRNGKSGAGFAERRAK